MTIQTRSLARRQVSEQKGSAVYARFPGSSRAGRSHGPKSCLVVISLTGSLTASGFADFRLLTHSR